LSLFEQEHRDATDFAAVPPSNRRLGPDPYRIASLHRSDRLIGILRGESAVVAIDRDGVEHARIAAPGSPSGLAIAGDGDIFVVGDNARELAQLRLDKAGDKLERVASVAVDALGLRDVALAADGKTAYAVEEHDGRVLAIDLARDRNRAAHATAVHELARCHGPNQIGVRGRELVVNCLLDHAIEIFRDGAAVARIHHDGPIWRFALHTTADGGLLIAAGGVEDHPLEREDGGFGYIDSFVFVYRLAAGATQPARLAAINTSELGVVTPKWLALRGGDAGAITLTTAGYASPKLLSWTWPGGDFASPPTPAAADLLPGTASAELLGDGTLVAGNPLFDAWVVAGRDGAPHTVAVASAQPARSAASRLGELLFFTSLLSPWNSSDGKLSRFTCETCHHEGYVDGRTHFTGRVSEGDNVFATTRPLLGLTNLRPFFSRGLDKTMTAMVHAEFRVANRHNGRDPWFSLSRADVPWLAEIKDAAAELTPKDLRQAFMSFLNDFTHRENPAVAAHAAPTFTAAERAGAQVFRDRCESCHAARLISDGPTTAVPFERWESLVLSPGGPIVWSNAQYAKTGVTPYVYDAGARVSPLRRLYKKWPYFTNGSAKSLTELLERFAWGKTGTYHEAAPAGEALERLTADDRAALLAFLDLL
ncbi:MAG TPA: c-type cytochrome, partial [Kofleriaceae bacterium]|nr:c-type cytochrome [Kofleriaceae bacterium]